MGRSLNVERQRQLRAEWRPRLLCWTRAGQRDSDRRLALLLGREGSIEESPAAVWKRAVESLREACVNTEDPAALDVRLDRWIDIYMLRPGHSLLWDASIRKRALSVGRDAQRRARRAAEGQRVITLTVSTAAVAALDAFQRNGAFSSRDKAADDILKHARFKPRPAKQVPAPPRPTPRKTPDLFSNDGGTTTDEPRP